jgi:hypothetical protein
MDRFVIVIAAFLSGCAGLFNPQPGMSLDDWKRNAGLSGHGVPELVGLKGSISVYHLKVNADQNIFYWFENGRLTQVTQGELPQIRLQIENINR